MALSSPSSPVLRHTYRFGVGGVFCDFTFCTLAKDSRSVGGILTRTVGDLLTKAWYQHWYWGFALPYMREYDVYGGREVPREEFAEMFAESLSCTPRDVGEVVRGGEALVMPYTADGEIMDSP